MTYGVNLTILCLDSPFEWDQQGLLRNKNKPRFPIRRKDYVACKPKPDDVSDPKVSRKLIC